MHQARGFGADRQPPVAPVGAASAQALHWLWPFFNGTEMVERSQHHPNVGLVKPASHGATAGLLVAGGIEQAFVDQIPSKSSKIILDLIQLYGSDDPMG